jgi:hypothetical protein
MTETFDGVRRATSGPWGRRPESHEVHALIARAKDHALGLEFLRHGAHDAVAMTFGVHAFVVDAAREHLADARTGDRSAR